MKKHYFVKFDRRVNQIIGCQRATLILSTLEFYSSRQPDGFYKFIEPNSHKLYKKDESWTELLGCHRTSFWRAFNLIGKKHTSRWTFEESKDKFEGKLYASYYDRNTNRMFFIRNHDAVKEFFAKIQPGSELADKEKTTKGNSHPSFGFNLGNNSVRTEQNAQSYKEPKKTSFELFKNNSHASEEIVKKMIELWTALVEGGKGQIDLTSRRIAFLKQAFKDKFDSCLEKWKKYCESIASSRFLMGEIKSSFRATLDWALKFDIIQKILEGNYGIGDRNPSSVPSACESFLKNSKIELDSEEEIIQKATDEPELVKAFRLKWLNKFGANNYRECLKDCVIEAGNDATLILRPNSRYNAKSIASYWTQTLLADSTFVRANVVQQEGDLIFDKWFGAEQIREGAPPEDTISQVKVAADLVSARLVKTLAEATNFVEEAIEEFREGTTILGAQEGKEGSEIVMTSETGMLRKKLREIVPFNQFPSWLARIEVESISKDGIAVVTLEDSLTVGWCQSRFSQEILQSATSLWGSVDRVIIRQKVGEAIPLSIENLSKKSENTGEKLTLEQAIQSFLSVCSPTKPAGPWGTQEACRAFG